MSLPSHCDLVIRGGTVVDGSNGASWVGDVGISGDRIVGIGDLSGASAAREVDATGRVVAPGFIDVHTHDDHLLIDGPDLAPKLSQGVTTVITGNCGISLAPLRPGRQLPRDFDLLGDIDDKRFDRFGDYLDRLDRIPAAVNAACLVGHTTLRVGSMDRLDGPANDREIAAMREALDDALDAGAVGMSSGLQYDSAFAAPLEEVVALVERLGPAGAIYTTHIRNESDRVVEALEEALATARRAGVRLLVSHHKVAGPRNYGRSVETLAIIDRARRHQRVALDIYPYVAGSSVLNRKSAANATRTVITWSKADPSATGRDLQDLAREAGCTVEECIERLQPAGAIYYCMEEADVRRILRYSGTMIGSDGLPHDEMSHPRLWGTFPRILGRYCRSLGILSLEEAVHRMTALAADEFGLVDRGRVRVGCFADLVVFDPATVEDRATYAEPTRPAAGIDIVLVNGVPAWEHGRPTGERQGRVLRRHAN